MDRVETGMWRGRVHMADDFDNSRGHCRGLRRWSWSPTTSNCTRTACGSRGKGVGGPAFLPPARQDSNLRPLAPEASGVEGRYRAFRRLNARDSPLYRCGRERANGAALWAISRALGVCVDSDWTTFPYRREATGRTRRALSCCRLTRYAKPTLFVRIGSICVGVERA